MCKKYCSPQKYFDDSVDRFQRSISTNTAGRGMSMVELSLLFRIVSRSCHLASSWTLWEGEGCYPEGFFDHLVDFSKDLLQHIISNPCSTTGEDLKILYAETCTAIAKLNASTFTKTNLHLT